MPPRRKADDDAPAVEGPRTLPTRGSLAGPRRPRQGFTPAPPVKADRK